MMILAGKHVLVFFLLLLIKCALVSVPHYLSLSLSGGEADHCAPGRARGAADELSDAAVPRVPVGGAAAAGGSHRRREGLAGRLVVPGERGGKEGEEERLTDGLTD